MSLVRLLAMNTEKAIELQNILNSISINREVFNSEKNLQIKVPYRLKNFEEAGLVGTAFDYLARFLLKRLEYKNNRIYKEESLVAEYGLKVLKRNESNDFFEFNEKRYNNGLSIVEEYVKCEKASKELFESLLETIIYFSKLEHIFRSGYTNKSKVNLNNKMPINIKTELIELIKVFKVSLLENFNLETSKIIYNPSFGRCSLSVNGADADIIINNVLIDFKTSKKHEVDNKTINQLLGYYLFSKIQKVGKIDTIALYHARYGKFTFYKFNSMEKKSIGSAIIKLNDFVDKYAVFY